MIAYEYWKWRRIQTIPHVLVLVVICTNVKALKSVKGVAGISQQTFELWLVDHIVFVIRFFVPFIYTMLVRVWAMINQSSGLPSSSSGAISSSKNTSSPSSMWTPMPSSGPPSYCSSAPMT